MSYNSSSAEKAYMTIFLLYTILYLVATIGIFCVAALVFLRQKSKLNLSFALFTAFLGTWVLLQFVAQFVFEISPTIADVAFRATLALPAFYAVEFYQFVMRYTGKLTPAKTATTHHYIIPGVAAVMAFIPGLLYSDVSLSYAGIVVTASLLYYVLILFVVGYTGTGVWRLVVYMLQNTKNYDVHYRTKSLLTGVIVAALIILGAIVFLPDVVISQLSIPIGVLALVSLFGYAIVKHRLFDIRLIAVRLLAYLLSLLTVALLYTLLAFGLFANLLDIDGITVGQEASFVVIALLLALTFAPLKRFFDKATRAIFYQDSYQTQDVLDAVGSIVVSRVEVNKLARESLKVMHSAFKSEFAVIVLINSESKGLDRTIQVGKVGSLTDVVAAVVRRAMPLVVTDDLERQESSFYRVLQGSGVSVVASLETSKDLIGYVLYGYKANGRIYSGDDVNLIKITADELAVAIQNALRFEEIARFNETLQKEIDEATTELRESNKKLKSLDQAKDEFISMASHQLRTPLTSVKGYVSMVLEEDAGKLNPTQHQLLEQAFASSQRMVYLISDFLNVSRLQTGKFTIERTPINLADLVTQEVQQLRSTAESRNLTIEANVPSSFPVLSLDESKLRQAIMNFIDNAIFYSRPPAVIKVGLTKTAKELVLTVQDQGIGVPPSERHHLFTKFYRASNARIARPDGTGIGLFMAKKVVVAHGGSIVFNTIEGKGSTFGFRLPLSQPSAGDESKKFK